MTDKLDYPNDNETVVRDLIKQYAAECTDDDVLKLVHSLENKKMDAFNYYIGDVLLKTEIVTFLITIKTGIGRNLIPIGRLICNKKIDTPDFNLPVLIEKSWIATVVDNDFSNRKHYDSGITYLGSSLWTCNCKSNYIKTGFHRKCTECGVKQKYNTPLYKSITDFFSERVHLT